MSQLYDLPVIGVDVAAEFSVPTILSPSGDIFKKNFRFIHTLDGFESFLQLIKKTEEEFNRKPQVFCESTGIYHLTLLHFLNDRQIDIHVINPLITNSNKNFNIRKVKNDKLDSFSIARLYKFNDIKTSFFTSKDMLYLKLLVRDYYKIVDLRTNAKQAFTNALYIYYPGMQKAFTDLTDKTPLAFITKYPTPTDLLNASTDEFNHNISLLCSFKGTGFISAITLLVEMNDINNFAKASQLVAFFGVDPAVNESGNFKGDSNKMSKRGTAVGRRALYAIALSSIPGFSYPLFALLFFKCNKF